MWFVVGVTTQNVCLDPLCIFRIISICTHRLFACSVSYMSVSVGKGATGRKVTTAKRSERRKQEISHGNEYTSDSGVEK